MEAHLENTARLRRDPFWKRAATITGTRATVAPQWTPIEGGSKPVRAVPAGPRTSLFAGNQAILTPRRLASNPGSGTSEPCVFGGFVVLGVLRHSRASFPATRRCRRRSPSRVTDAWRCRPRSRRLADGADPVAVHHRERDGPGVGQSPTLLSMRFFRNRARGGSDRDPPMASAGRRKPRSCRVLAGRMHPLAEQRSLSCGLACYHDCRSTPGDAAAGPAGNLD